MASPNKAGRASHNCHVIPEAFLRLLLSPCGIFSQMLLALACVVAFAAAMDTAEITADDSQGMMELGDAEDDSGIHVLGTDEDESERAVERDERKMGDAAAEDIHEPAQVPGRPFLARICTRRLIANREHDAYHFRPLSAMRTASRIITPTSRPRIAIMSFPRCPTRRWTCSSSLTRSTGGM